MAFDTAGASPAASAPSKWATAKSRAARIVFATDYPGLTGSARSSRDFVEEIRAPGADGERILSGNVGLLFKEPVAAAKAR